jgi:hypothetical protein
MKTMDFDKLTQQQVKSILLDVKRQANGTKQIDTKSVVMDIKNRILSVISSEDE